MAQRIDERRAIRQYGSRGQQRQQQRTATPGAAPDLERAAVVWVFSGVVVCSGCGARLRANGTQQHTPAIDARRLYYRDTARQRGIACPVGMRGRRGAACVRADALDAAIAAALDRPLLPGWRERVLAEAAALAHETPDWQVVETRRAHLIGEIERLKFQHRHGLLSDEALVREADRLQQQIRALPSAESHVAHARESLALGDALTQGENATASERRTLADYWRAATPEQQCELVSMLLTPEGLCYDLRARRLVALRPRPTALPILRDLLTTASADGDADDDGDETVIGWQVVMGRPGDVWLLAPGVARLPSGVTRPLSGDAQYFSDDASARDVDAG